MMKKEERQDGKVMVCIGQKTNGEEIKRKKATNVDKMREKQDTSAP